MVHWASAFYIYMLIYYEMGNNDYEFAESSHEKSKMIHVHHLIA